MADKRTVAKTAADRFQQRSVARALSWKPHGVFNLNIEKL